MTFDEFDALCESLRKMENPNPLYIPSEEEIAAYAKEDPQKYLMFMLFISETADQSTPTQKERMKPVNKFLREHLVLE